jgi:hypothetical protein
MDRIAIVVLVLLLTGCGHRELASERRGGTKVGGASPSLVVETVTYDAAVKTYIARVRFENTSGAPWPVGTGGDLASGEVFVALGIYHVERLVGAGWQDITGMNDSIAVQEMAAPGAVFHFNARLPGWMVEPGMVLRIIYCGATSERFTVPDKPALGQQ